MHSVHLPGLRRLDLSEMPLSSLHVRRILEVAGERCTELEALVLPGKERQQALGDELEPLMRALFEAMKKWEAREKNPGLRQLTVPNQPESDRLRSSTELIEDVAAFCPNVELLDGYKHSLRESEGVTCDDQLFPPLSVWRRFNGVCTQITEFNWVVVPFADPYFWVFGQYTKPQLTTLTLCANTSWDWSAYFEAMGEEVEGCVNPDGSCKKPDYGPKAIVVDMALMGCPNLTTLEIVLCHSVNGRGMTSTSKGVNPEVVNDYFCEN